MASPCAENAGSEFPATKEAYVLRGRAGAKPFLCLPVVGEEGETAVMHDVGTSGIPH